MNDEALWHVTRYLRSEITGGELAASLDLGVSDLSAFLDALDAGCGTLQHMGYLSRLVLDLDGNPTQGEWMFIAIEHYEPTGAPEWETVPIYTRIDP